jgi:hypothetical protein
VAGGQAEAARDRAGQELAEQLADAEADGLGEQAEAEQAAADAAVEVQP